MRIDVVYPVGPKRYEPDVLRWSLRSLEANYLPMGEVVFVGHRPEWASSSVIHIPTDQSGTKFENIERNVLAAAYSDRISDPYLWMNDDTFMLKQVSSVPLFARASFMDAYVDSLNRRLRTNRTHNFKEFVKGIKSQRRIMRDIGSGDTSTAVNTDSHFPMTISRPHMQRMIEFVNAEYPEHCLAHFKALYRDGRPVVMAQDPKVMSTERVPIDEVYVSTNNRSWGNAMGEWLRAAFPNRSRWETTDPEW